jgi:hypothetical protein
VSTYSDWNRGSESNLALPTNERREDRQQFFVANVVGALLIVVGTFLPYVHLVVSVSGFSESISRNGWQLGANKSATANGGPVICVFALLIVIGAALITWKGANFRLFATKSSPQNVLLSRSRRFPSQALLIVVAGFVVVIAWSGKWKPEQYVVPHRSPAGLLSLVGVAICLGATLYEWRRESASTSTQFQETAPSSLQATTYVRSRRLNAYFSRHPIVRAMSVSIMFGGLGVFVCYRAIILNQTHALPWWSDSAGVVLGILEFSFFSYASTRKLSMKAMRNMPQLRVVSAVVMCAMIASLVVALPAQSGQGDAYAFAARYQVVGDLALLGFCAFLIVRVGLRPLFRSPTKSN